MVRLRAKGPKPNVGSLKLSSLMYCLSSTNRPTFLLINADKRICNSFVASRNFSKIKSLALGNTRRTHISFFPSKKLSSSGKRDSTASWRLKLETCLRRSKVPSIFEHSIFNSEVDLLDDVDVNPEEADSTFKNWPGVGFSGDDCVS